MHTYTQIIYQIVFSTYRRKKTLVQQDRQELYRYIWGILQRKKCHLYRINGVSDHIHIVTYLHPSISLSSLVRDIKLASSRHIKSKGLFPQFKGWQEGYGGFTYSYKERDRLIEYVKNQESHHKEKDFRQEYIKLLREQGVKFDERYLL